MATDHIFTGFGFGPIQSGLFAKEAFASGNFSRIVVAEIDRDLVDAVRGNSVASLLAGGLTGSTAPATVIYAAENNNQAAEILQETLSRASDPRVMPGSCHKKGTRAGRPRHDFLRVAR